MDAIPRRFCKFCDIQQFLLDLLRVQKEFLKLDRFDNVRYANRCFYCYKIKVCIFELQFFPASKTMKLFSTNRVLVPIDFSEESFKAQQLTLDFVEDPNCLHVLHVLRNLNPGDPGIVWDTMDDRTRQESVKKAFFEKFNEAKYQKINFTVAIGDPSDRIIEYAKKHSIELIVIPSHGRTGIGRFFLGSVAEKVVRYAHCPVLVLRRDEL